MAKRVKIPGRLESAETGNIVTGADAIMDDEKGKTQVVINSEVDAAITRIEQGKQDALTFDNAPTEDSPNPVTSAGVYTADKVLSDAIEAILLLIPSAAGALNKLVDMQTMNSSIATATASFKGTYNLVSDLHLGVDATHEQIGDALDALSLGADNNDYAFVQVPDSATAPTEISKTERYKYNGINWMYEYDLNNSGFTQGQWNAINSGVTSLLVDKLSKLPTNAELAILLAGKQDNLTFDNVPTAGSPNPVKSGGVYARNNEIVALINALDAAKQDVLTFDNAPVEGSTNPVKSGGVYTAISAVQTAIVALDAAKQNVLTFDSTPTLGSPNPVTSSGIKTELNRIDGNVTMLNDLYEALTQSALVVVQPTDTWPVANPEEQTIYRVVDRVNTPPQYYSDYMWNGTAMVLMATYDNAIDPRPKKNSQNLVTSGGVFDNMGALDVSELNATENPHTLAQYVDLSAALAAIPTDYQKGGMSIKFVQSPDNKYVQYMYNNADTTGFTNTANWQKMNLKEEVSKLYQKVDIFQQSETVDFSDDVYELWLVKVPTEQVKFQSFNNKAYFFFPGTTIYVGSEVVSENKVAYPIKVYSGATEEFPMNFVVGYVMFRDVNSFKSKSSTSGTQMQFINTDMCFNLANSPMIAASLGEIIVDAGKIGGNELSAIFEQNGTTVKTATNATNSINATNATNATSVVDSKTEHSGFVKELYLFGSGVDKTKTYSIISVRKNYSTYKYGIIIEEVGSITVCALEESLDMPSNPVLLSSKYNSNVFAYAIVNWDEFEDGTNNATNITLLPRIFDLNYCPTIKALLNIEKLQVDSNNTEIDVANIQNDLYDTTITEFGRSDFKVGYLSTVNESIGNVVSLPSDSTPVTSESGSGHLTLEVNKGDTLKATYKSTSNKWLRAWVLLDKNRKILAWSNPQSNQGYQQTVDYFLNPLNISIVEDGYLILQFIKADYDDNLDLNVECVHRVLKDTAYDSVEVCIPNEIVAVVGDTLQLYYHSIYRCVDYSKYAVKVTCDIGAQYPRYFEITPLVGQVGNHTLTFAIKDNNDNLLGTKSTILKVVAAGTSPQNELNVLCLGASGTMNGQWASEFKRRLTGNGGTPAGNNLSNITFVGRMSETFEGKQVNLEATGGYFFPSYTTVDTARYRFDVTAANEPIISVGDVYSNNGNNYEIVEINITAGSGGYFSCEGSGTPQSSGTLTLVRGSGSATITYESTRFSGNPFVYNGAIDMQQYADDYCNPQNAAHGKIDVIYTELFGNGTNVYTEDFTTRMSQMQTFIDQVRTTFPNCKFCIGLSWNPDVRGGMGVNYGASGTWSDPYGIKYSNMGLCLALQKYITDNNLSDYVYVLNWLNEFDTWNDMQQTNKKVNPRSPVTEIFGVNGVHPSIVGYNQMADTAWRLFVAKFCQSN